MRTGEKEYESDTEQGSKEALSTDEQRKSSQTHQCPASQMITPTFPSADGMRVLPEAQTYQKHLPNS